MPRILLDAYLDDDAFPVDEIGDKQPVKKFRLGERMEKRERKQWRDERREIAR